MKVVVDLSVCQGHSQCEQAAPEVFSVREGPNGFQSVVINENPEPALREKVEAAVRRCPSEALSISE